MRFLLAALPLSISVIYFPLALGKMKKCKRKSAAIGPELECLSGLAMSDQTWPRFPAPVTETAAKQF